MVDTVNGRHHWCGCCRMLWWTLIGEYYRAVCCERVYFERVSEVKE